MINFEEFATSFIWGNSQDASNAALPFLGASKTETTVSGISSGGFQAVQMHVAFSDTFKGSGIVADSTCVGVR